MDILSPIVLVTAVGGLGVLLLGALGLVLRQARQLRAQARQLARVQHELQVVNNSVIGMGQRLLAMERRRHQGNAPASNDSDEGAIAYRQAGQWLQQGMTAEEVARRSGLSQAEVSLLALMHQRQPVH